MGDNKPGIASTEFWITVLKLILTLCVVSGVVKPGDQATLEGAITNGVTAVASVIGVAWVLVTYIRSRTALKQQPGLSSQVVQQVVERKELQ